MIKGHRVDRMMPDGRDDEAPDTHNIRFCFCLCVSFTVSVFYPSIMPLLALILDFSSICSSPLTVSLSTTIGFSSTNSLSSTISLSSTMRQGDKETKVSYR